METIKNIYKIGPGPSSSHTIAPYNAAKDFLKHINKYYNSSEFEKYFFTFLLYYYRVVYLFYIKSKY